MFMNLTETSTSACTGLHHPLEPLTADELRTTVNILHEGKQLGKTIRFVSIVLKEPSKKYVKGFHQNGELRREAFVVLFDNGTNKCFEAVVSLNEKRITSWKHIPGVQPTMTADEQIECEKAVLESEEFQAACKRHGVEDIDLVMVDIWTAGN
jgi:primary-amine oxidase